MKPICLFLSLMFLLAACASAPDSKSWPETMPPQSLYEEYYDADQEHQKVLSKKQYLVWVKRFYQGWVLYRKGWLEATDELVQTLETKKEKSRANAIMYDIGVKVSAEWAKSDPHRVINTRHVSLWGNAVLESIVKEQQIALVTKVLNDVNALLAGKLKPNDIVKSRYFTEEPFGESSEWLANDF